MGRNPKQWSDVKELYAYTMGDKNASLVKDTKIKYGPTPGNRGGSMPVGTIYIPTDDTYQGGYNPGYPNGERTETGHVGLHAHELWHQVQYKTRPGGSIIVFLALGIEQGFYKNPYFCGDPIQNPGMLNTVKSLSDIGTLEGQAQFTGQWNADVFDWLNGKNADMNRLKKEARIILNSGIDSPAARDIISMDTIGNNWRD